MGKCKWTNLMECKVENPSDIYCITCLSTQTFNITLIVERLIETLMDKYGKVIGAQVIRDLERLTRGIPNKCRYTSALSCSYYAQNKTYPSDTNICLICLSKNGYECIFLLNKNINNLLDKLGIKVERR